jgi:hypothetical protein
MPLRLPKDIPDRVGSMPWKESDAMSREDGRRDGATDASGVPDASQIRSPVITFRPSSVTRRFGRHVAAPSWTRPTSRARRRMSMRTSWAFCRGGAR